jgi:predicted outer membrane repeat protein
MPIACADSKRAGPADHHRGRQRALCAGCGDGVSLLRRRLALSVGRCWLPLIFVSAFAISLPIVRQAVAATINVPAGTNLGALPSSDLANGNILSLQGNVTLSGSLNAPTGSPGLTINGNSHTITLTNGDFALPGNSVPNLSLQNVTIEGGNNTSAISGVNDQGVNIPITGNVTFSNIHTPQTGSAIGLTSNGTVAIGGSGSAVSFDNNTAPSGGAISIANAGFALSGIATFSGNMATSGNGGAINSAGNSAFTINGPVLEFTGNTAAGGGGAIFAENNSIIIDSNVDGNVTLSNNHAMRGNGGAIDEASNSVLIGSAGSTVMITGNTATANGGAINSRNTGVTISGDDITLQGNMAGGNGGAVFENSGPVLIGDANGATVNISGNIAGSVAGSNGGAIYDNNSSVTVNGNARLTNNIAASGSGGAIYETNGSVLISNSGGNVSLTGNTAGINGGAIYEGGSGAVTIGSSAATVDITGNQSMGGQGGAIYGGGGSVTIHGSNVTVANDMAGTDGGAIFTNGSNPIAIGDTGATVSITDNTSGGQGGAVNGGGGSVTIHGNNVTLDGNTAGTGGGAIFTNGSVAIGDDGGATVNITGNQSTGGQGGAVYAGNGFTLTAGAPAGGMITGNMAAGQGGAIFLNGGNLDLNAMGGNIIFSGNTENNGAPNAIYFNNTGPAPSQATFNTAVGQKISFFDPIESNGTNGIVSVTKTGPGTVSFDGALNPNVSNIFAQTTVQEGTFEVAHNAVYGVNAPNTSFTVNSGAILQGGVAGTVAASQFMLQSGATFNIAGNAPPSQGFSVFTIDAAQASFQSGSRTLFNTELNDGSVQRTDLLVLSHGIADGPGGVVVTNFGGQGAETVGDGIRLVEAINGATTTPNNFALLGEVRGGAFDYDLFRGDLTPVTSRTTGSCVRAS